MYLSISFNWSINIKQKLDWSFKSALSNEVELDDNNQSDVVFMLHCLEPLPNLILLNFDIIYTVLLSQTKFTEALRIPLEKTSGEAALLLPFGAVHFLDTLKLNAR